MWAGTVPAQLQATGSNPNQDTHLLSIDKDIEVSARVYPQENVIEY